MRNSLILFILAGLTTVAAAVFARALGLDQYGGWGRARLALLLFGLLITTCSVLGFIYSDRLVLLRRHIRYFVGGHPLVSHLDRNLTLAQLFRFFLNYWFVLPLFVIVIVIYIWFVSSGTWTTWISPTRHYADLARGFQRGNLYLPTQVNPKLLELDNPYDPVARAGIKTPWDLTYYNGRYYLYYGPVPALILVAINPFIRGRVGDLQLVFGFVCGVFLMQFVLVVTIWNRYFRKLPKWILAMSVLLVGLAGPVTFILEYFRNARIYEAAITGGQFFLIAGFLAALTALERPSASSWLLAVAGTLWVLAIGTRQLLVLPVGFLLFMVAHRLLVNNWRFNILKLIPLGISLIIGCAGLGWYNWARFGSVTESGYFYQLAGPDLQKNYSFLFSPVYILQNLYNYCSAPFVFSSQYPFINLINGKKTPIFPSYSFPTIYNAQIMTGFLYMVPFVIYALLPAGSLLAGIFNKGAVQILGIDGKRSLLNWITVSLNGAFLAAFGSLLFFFWAAMRYMEDFMPALVLLAVIGFWQGYQILSQKAMPKRLYLVFGAILGIASIIMSILVGVAIKVMPN